MSGYISSIVPAGSVVRGHDDDGTELSWGVGKTIPGGENISIAAGIEVNLDVDGENIPLVGARTYRIPFTESDLAPSPSGGEGGGRGGERGWPLVDEPVVAKPIGTGNRILDTLIAAIVESLNSYKRGDVSGALDHLTILDEFKASIQKRER
jgi:hypothetical protein